MMKACMIFCTDSQSDEDSPTVSTLQLQNNAGLQLPLYDIELDNATDCNSENDYETSDILKMCFQI